MEDKTTYVDLNTKDLPSETWLHILLFLQPKDLLNVEMVCKLFKQISCDNTLWRSFVLVEQSNCSMNKIPSINPYL